MTYMYALEDQPTNTFHTVVVIHLLFSFLHSTLHFEERLVRKSVKYYQISGVGIVTLGWVG